MSIRTTDDESTPGWSAPDSLPPVVRHGPRSRREVALTFDADLTEYMRKRLISGQVASYANMRVVEELQQANVPATMFLTGLWMEEYSAETEYLAADDRFELATHSQTHRAFREDCFSLGYVPPEDMLEEVVRPIERLRNTTPRYTRYFRFPGGCYDETALRAISSAAVTVVDFDVVSGDAFCDSADTIVEQTLSRATNGSIILMHLNGGPNAPQTANALPRVIDGIRAIGLTPVTLTQLLK
ncbi:polysaccharide deacetylase family protein [Streptomyces hokutonensis]|uniref:polysaccharide deacetylase family protein n=1 Tax=Streptomyces hokutonensis TaxID=1306990 RepID=UPI003818F021